MTVEPGDTLSVEDPDEKDEPASIPEISVPSFVPGAVRAPRKTLANAMIWIYGEPKIGKTTLASKFPGVWFLATEKGQDWISVREPSPIENWIGFTELMGQIITEKPTHFGDGELIRTLCIDTYDILFQYCFQYVCNKMGVADPGEIPHGGGWSKLNLEFARVMGKVRQLPYGLIIISHARQKEFKTRGRKIDRYEPYVGAAGFRWASSASDLILLAHSSEEVGYDEDNKPTTIKETRKLLCHPQSWAVGGGRMSNMLPITIPLDYDELLKHFPDTED